MDVSKREKYLLGGMGGAILAALIYLIWPSAAPPSQEMTPKQLDDARKAAETQFSSLERIKLSGREMHTVTSSQDVWPRDPFGPKPPDPESQVDKEKFQYTGFVSVGGRKLAVINGREYQVGEQLESGGFEVSDISPDAVVLRGLTRQNEVRIPYLDPSFFGGK